MPLIQISPPFNSISIEHPKQIWDSSLQSYVTQVTQTTLYSSRPLWIQTEKIIAITENIMYMADGITIHMDTVYDYEKVTDEINKYIANKCIDEMLR